MDFDKNSDGNIDADDYYYNGGKGWAPIGNATKPFTATFNGDNKTISNLYINSTDGTADIGLFGVIGKCDATGNNCTDRGVIKNLGLINAGVTRNHTSMGSVGTLAGFLTGGEVISCYATGSVSHPGPTTRPPSSTGGLIGAMGASGKMTASYATTSVAGGATTSVVTNRVGGLVGRSNGTITASYAAGSVRETGRAIVGGLVGYNNTLSGGVITASYAIGAVHRTASATNGGLFTSSPPLPNGTFGVTSSYWDTGTTGRTTSDGRTIGGKATRELQSTTGYTGIYTNWDVDLDGDGVNDNPWDFGTPHQYPALKYGGLDPYKQRQLSIRSDSWNAPVAGEPVFASAETYTIRATLNIPATAAITTTWQWQHSTGGTEWTNAPGASATSAIYYPVAEDDDAATDDVHDEGKYLRAEATFTYNVSGSSVTKTLTTANTAKVTAAPAASAAVTVVPIVGEKLRYALPAGVTLPDGVTVEWRWMSCVDAKMTSCALRHQSNLMFDAHTEYTPVAGTDTDVGKYLRAYAYYAANDAGKTWTRTETPVLGPVVAAPTTSP